MAQDDQKSVAGQVQSPIVRGAFMLLVALAALAIGHFGLGRLRSAQPTAAATMQFGERSGQDAADVPRPPRAERQFSMASPNRPTQILLRYVSAAAEDEIVRFYRERMPARGWLEQKLPAGAPTEYPGSLLCYSNAGGNSCMIAVNPAHEGGTAVTILRMALPVQSR